MVIVFPCMTYFPGLPAAAPGQFKTQQQVMYICSSCMCNLNYMHTDWQWHGTEKNICNKATPIKCLDLDDTSGQRRWLAGYCFYCLYTLLNEEASFYWQVGRGGTILLVLLERRPHFLAISERRHHFIGRRLVEFFLLTLTPKTMLNFGWIFIPWYMLYPVGWSSRTSYFIGVAYKYMRSLLE